MTTKKPLSQKEKNKAIARRYYDEIMNEAKLDVIDELMAPDFMFTIPTHPDPYHGPEGFKELVTMLHGAFPDVHLTVEHLVAQGDTVVGHWTGTGTHTGGPLKTLKGDIPASGKSFSIDGMSWLKIVDGQIVESLANEDTFSLLNQIGFIPLPQEHSVLDKAKPSENRKVVGHFFNDVLNKGKVELLGEMLTSDCIFHALNSPEPIVGIEGMTRYVQELRTGFPDLKFCQDRHAIEKEKVAVRWKLNGTHLGAYWGAEATGNPVSNHGVYIFYFTDGKIHEIWVNEHYMGLMGQIGLLPEG